MFNIIVIPYYYNSSGDVSDLIGWLGAAIIAISLFSGSAFVAKGAWDDGSITLCAGAISFSIIAFAVTIYCIYQVLLIGGVL